MKTLRHIFWLLVCLAYMALARPITVAWDTPPAAEFVVGWRVWSGSTLLGASSVPQVTVNIPNGGPFFDEAYVNACIASARLDAISRGTGTPTIQTVTVATDPTL